MRIVIILSAIAILFSCQSNEKPKAPAATTPATIAAPALQQVPYPPVPQDLLSTIVTKGDHVDIVFYKLPISMSRDGQKDVIQELARLTDQSPQARANCVADGRIFYQGGGETIAEADLYINEGCYYVVFYKDKKPTYANGLTPEAIQFFKQFTQQYQK